jgi:O-antigen ligase
MTTLSSARGWSAAPSPSSGLLITIGAALAAALAFALVHGSAAAVVAVAVVPPAVWLLSRSHGGLVLGLILILVLPYWYSLGLSHVTILRVASLAAATTLLVNHRITLRRLDFALAVLVLLLVADWLLQYQQPGASSALVYELVPIGFYLGARALPPGQIRTVALIVVIAGALGGLTVIYEFMRGHVILRDPSSYDWNPTNDSIFRPGGVFGGPPAASSVMCCVILFGIACLATYRGKTRLVVGACTLIASVALVLTFTRAAMIAAGVGIILFLWLIRSPLLRPLRVAWFVALLAGVYFLLIPTLQGNRTFQQGIERSGTLAAREGYWSVALPVATSSVHAFVLGAGTGSLEAPRTAPDATVVSRIATSPQLTDNSLHSQYMTTLFEQGALGLAVLVALLLAGIIPSARFARTTRDPIGAATVAIIVALAVIMSVDTVSLSPPAFSMLMLALAFGGAFREEGRQLRRSAA